MENMPCLRCCHGRGICGAGERAGFAFAGNPRRSAPEMFVSEGALPGLMTAMGQNLRLLSWRGWGCRSFPFAVRYDCLTGSIDED